MLKHTVKKGMRRVEEIYCDCDAQNEAYSIMKDAHTRMTLSRLIDECHVTHLDVCGLKGDVEVLHTLSDLLEAFPKLRIRCLEKFSPSSDGGEKLRGWLEDKGLSESPFPFL